MCVNAVEIPSTESPLSNTCTTTNFVQHWKNRFLGAKEVVFTIQVEPLNNEVVDTGEVCPSEREFVVPNVH